MYLKAMAATMASSEIQIVNIANLSKIENFLNDSAYKEILENSENYNTRLCIERRLRMPFLDPQTGVAQNHCALFMKRQQRMPGLREGQIYTYPAARWRKSRRQYLLHQHRPFRVLKEESEPIPVAALDGSSMGAGDTDSKDSHSHSMNMSMSMSHRDEPKDWYYDEMSMHDVDGFEVNDPDSDYDYEDSYRKRKRGRKAVAPEGPPKKRTNRGRRKKDPDTPSRRKGGNTNNTNTGAAAQSSSACASPLSMSSLPSDDQPLSSTMPMSNESTMSPHMLTPMTPVSPHPMQPYSPQMQQPPMQLQQLQPPMSMGQPPQPAIPGQPPQGYPQPSPALQAHLMAQQQHQQQQQQQQHPQSHPSQMQQTTGPGATPHTGQPAVEGESERMRKNLEKGKAAPSPYCDFCLGDTRENKKSGMPEDLVSCADCGRSGHPTCLQFTPNMIISVKRYRWQCIECKYCSICGTSDNDDQLLFCDDCDRGYHMYCLAPPLTDPPEGSWSCKLCQQEFHSGKK